MTLYDYKCESGHVTTGSYAMGYAPPEKVCHCGGLAHRIYGATAIHPNGSSGDGYFRDSRTGATSRDKSVGNRDGRWV